MKKTTAIVTAAVLAAMTVSGCGKKETSVDGDYKELKVTVWNTQGTEYTPPNKIEDNVVSKWLHDKTGVTVGDIYGNDGGQWDTKLSRLVTADSMPEVIVCGGGQGPAHFAKLAKVDKI